MASVVVNFVGGLPVQVLYDGVNLAIRRTRKFRSHLRHLRVTLEFLRRSSGVIQRIEDNNNQLDLPSEFIEILRAKMQDGIQLVGRLSELSMWDIRIWGNCCNCIEINCGDQLDDLNASLKLLLELLMFELRGNVTELLVGQRQFRDRQDEMETRVAEGFRRVEQIHAMLVEQRNAPGRNATDSVQQDASSNGGEEAAPALGEVFQQLFSAVIRLEVKSVMFKRLFHRLNCLQPLVEEISKSTRVLYLPKQEVENFIICIKDGVELVHECPKVCRKYDYTSKLLKLDESLQRLFSELKRQVGRRLEEAMDSANSIEGLEAEIKEIEGMIGVVQMNDLVSDVKEETLVDSERVIEEAVKPIEGSDPVQNQMETDQLPHEQPSPAVGLDVHTLKKTSDDVDEETLLDLARVKDEMIKPIDEGSDVLKNQTEREIAAAEPPSSSPAVGSTMQSNSNANTWFKRLAKKVAVLKHLKWTENASMTSFKRKHNETEVIMQVEFPYQCIANIISLTTPADACRLSSVSQIFRQAAESDRTWENFLPPDIHRILSQSTSSSAASVDPAKSKSKKEFYLDLCDNPVLIDNGKMSFWLDKWSGKKCYMISARALRVVWSGEKYRYWKWISLPESRFEEVPCLNGGLTWLEVRGKIDMGMMSPSTLYKAYMVYKLTPVAYGLETAVEVATRAREYGFEYGDLDYDGFIECPDKQRGCLDPDIQINGTLSPKERVDGWLEMELGEFLCQGEEDGELEMICVEMHTRKRGLIVQGFEVRPERKEHCEAKGKARSHSRDKGKKAMTMI